MTDPVFSALLVSSFCAFRWVAHMILRIAATYMIFAMIPAESREALVMSMSDPSTEKKIIVDCVLTEI